MSTVIAHDYLTQRGGAERVALTLAEGFSAKEIVTSAYVPSQTFPGFSSFAIRESTHLGLKIFKSDPRRALPFLAPAWDAMNPVSADVVICSTAGWSHGVPVADGTRKVVYCHNPARWLYQTDDFLQDQGFIARAGLAVLRDGLRRWDEQAVRSADAYIVNSTAVADRVRRVYNLDPTVIHPPVSVDVSADRDPDEKLNPGFFLSVGRARGYKGVSRLIDAFARTPLKQLVIVGTEHQPTFPSNVVGLGRVSESRLRWLYANACALISVSREDFGLTPIEANAFGTPSLLLRAGGFLDSTDVGVSGLFIQDEGRSSIIRAIEAFPEYWDATAVMAHAQKFSIERFVSQVADVVRDA
ncbi:glycosyltransferase [Microbacterium sp. PRF11]|uniref:glycosyltransferase n=1 Tax=Microbacterium sp. PRF11 TaxID=2962593 RepID=UPI002882C462|nr:glycosyltransferase [Microbacterium sp. PRF11]MDT0117736.1 glycosyltransferase [Microbacterium sp. PRF11]